MRVPRISLGAKIDGILGYMGCFEVLGAKIDGIMGYMGYRE